MQESGGDRGEKKPRKTFSATLFDGKATLKRFVNITPTPDGLLVDLGENRAVSWPYTGVRALSEGARGLRLEREVAGEEGPRTETLVVQHPDFARRLKEVAPSAFPGPFGNSISMRATVRIVAILIFLAPLLVYLMFKVVLPKTADGLADHIPLAVEEKIGQALLDKLKIKPDAPADAEVQGAIEAIADRLIRSAPASRYKFRFYLKEGNLVNALALPGGYIVIGRGLLNLTESPEELAGILAHELQHILLKHAMRGLVRNLGMEMIITLALGGENETLEVLLGMAAGMESLRYGREMERAADKEGMRLVRLAAVDPQGMVQVFIKLRDHEIKAREGSGFEGEGDGEASILDYFKTHPGGAERVRYLQEMASQPASAPTPLLPGFDWSKMHKKSALDDATKLLDLFGDQIAVK